MNDFKKFAVSESQLRSPCKECTLREVGCHGKCVDYQRYVLENERRRDDIRKKKYNEGNISCALRNGKKKR